MASESTIDRMLADPKFRQLMTGSPDRAKALVLEARQKDFGKIPETENFLQKAIRIVTHDVPAVGAGLTFPFPQIAREQSKVPFSAQVAGPIASLSSYIGGARKNKPAFDIPKATTEIGKKAEAIAPYVPLAYGLTKGAIGLGKGIKGAFTPFKKFPIEQEILGLEKEAERVAYSGAKAVKKAIPKKFIEAKDAYKAFIDEADVSGTTVEDLVEVLDKTIESKGIIGREFLRPAEKNLLSLRNTIASKVKQATQEVAEEIVDPLTNRTSRSIISEASKKVNPKIESIVEIKNFKNQIFNSLRGEHDLEGEFLKHYGDMLEGKGLEGLREVGSQYKKAYQLSKSAKSISKGALKRISTGKASSQEASDLVSIEKELGTGSVREASGVSKKLESANNKLQLAIRNQTRAKFLGGLTTVGGTILAGLKVMSGRD